MSHLILIRHGQSEWNLQNKFTGWVDVELSPQGKLEACKAGELIKELNFKIDYFFSSYQRRSIDTLKLILNTIREKDDQIIKAWELNERHYGALTGLNKDEIMKKHGKKKVHIWRRSFNVSPPPMEKTNPNHPSKNEAYRNIPANKIPNSESLKNTFDRVIPYYEKNIKPILYSNKNILISAHGNSLRALCKKLLNISDKKIINFEIPTGNPLLIVFDENLKVKKYKYLDAKRAKNILINV